MEGSSGSLLQDKCSICKTKLRVKFFLRDCPGNVAPTLYHLFRPLSKTGSTLLMKVSELQIPKSSLNSKPGATLASNPYLRWDNWELLIVRRNKNTMPGDFTLLQSIFLGYISTASPPDRHSRDPVLWRVWLWPDCRQYSKVLVLCLSLGLAG